MTQTQKRMSKTEIYAELAEKTGLGKKEVSAVFDQLGEMIERELGSKGIGEFVLPDLLKLKVRVTPAQPEREGLDPFTKQPRTFAAKPAQRKVKASPLKKLKELA